jgi:hypothetical protein
MPPSFHSHIYQIAVLNQVSCRDDYEMTQAPTSGKSDARVCTGLASLEVLAVIQKCARASLALSRSLGSSLVIFKTKSRASWETKIYPKKGMLVTCTNNIDLANEYATQGGTYHSSSRFRENRSLLVCLLPPGPFPFLRRMAHIHIT